MAKTTKATGTQSTNNARQNLTPEQFMVWYVGKLEKEQQAGSFVQSELDDARKDIKKCQADVLFRAGTKEKKAEWERRFVDDAFAQFEHRTYRTYGSLELADNISSLSPLQGDRSISDSRSTALDRSFHQALLPFNWAIAIVVDDSGNFVDVIRLNGNHSSKKLIEEYHFLTEAPEVVLTVFTVRNREEAVRAFQAMDLRQSMRTLRDLLYVEYHSVPALASYPISATLLQSFVAGLAFEYHWLKWDKLLPQEKIRFVSKYAEFIRWASRVFDGFKLGSGKGGVKKFMSAPVLAALYRAWDEADRRGKTALHGIFRRVMRMAVPEWNEKPVVILVRELKVSDDPEAQLSAWLQTKYLNVSRCIDKINELTTYDTMYAITAHALYMSLNGLRGPITKVTISPYGKARGDK